MKKIIKILALVLLTTLFTGIVFAESEPIEFKNKLNQNLPAGNYVVTSSKNITKEFTTAGDITIDLMNNTLTYAKDGNESDILFTIEHSLTLKNGTLQINNGYDEASLFYMNGGTLILESINLDSSKLPSSFIYKSGTYNFNPSTKGTMDTSVSGLGVYTKDNSVYTVGFKVTFDPNNNEDTFDEYIVNGKTVSKPQVDPSKSGYTFDCWQKDDADYDFTSSVSGNLTLKAKYTASTSGTQDQQSQDQGNQNQDQQNQENQNQDSQNKDTQEQETNYEEPVSKYTFVNTGC